MKLSELAKMPKEDKDKMMKELLSPEEYDRYLEGQENSDGVSIFERVSLIEGAFKLLHPLVFFKMLFSRDESDNGTQKMMHEITDLDSDFAAHYSQHIQPHLLDFEERRVASLKKFKKQFWLSIPIVLCIIVLAVWVYQADLKFSFIDGSINIHILLISLTLIFSVLVWVVYPTASYSSQFKSVIFPKIFNYFGEDYEFDPRGEISTDQLKKSSILPSYNSYDMEDYIKGSYKGVALEIIEGHFTQTQGSSSSNNKSSKTVFDGLLLLLTAHKNFTGKTIIIKDQGKIGNFFTDKLLQRDLEKVNLEDPVFEKQFEVYSSDQVEARYLLTVTFMERLLKLSSIHDGKIQCSFYDNKLLIMIQTKKNYFEAGPIYEPLERGILSDMNTIRNEMGTIYQLIDILKLDQKTGL